MLITQQSLHCKYKIELLKAHKNHDILQSIYDQRILSPYAGQIFRKHPGTTKELSTNVQRATKKPRKSCDLRGYRAQNRRII
jgi:hypothetical protein